MCSKKLNKKKNWIIPEVSRIKLNPEQAVLSCCDNSNKIMVTTTAMTTVNPSVQQCLWLCYLSATHGSSS